MTKLAARSPTAAATSLVLSIAFIAALLLPATGVAEEPLLSFSPSPVGFAKATVGTESQAQAIDVYNGSGDVAVDQVVIEGAEGESAPPELAFTPGSHDFGIQRVNRGEGSANFQLANVGEAAAQVGSVGIGGPDTSNFWTNGGDCWGGRWLQPGESCNVQVGFNPWDTVSYDAQLQASVNGATFSADLAGQGGRAIVEPTSSPTDFGSVTVGSVGAVETIVFLNHGNLPGNFFIGIVAGGDSGSFRLLDEDCSGAPLQPSRTCTAHVRFVPQGVGPKVARMAFFGDDEGGVLALLSGEGVAAAVTLAPSAHDFGFEAIGGRSIPRSFAVRNDGEAPLDLGGVSIVGAELDQFALAGDECTGTTLAPGGDCMVRVRFAPDSAGAKAATLRVGSDAGAFTAALGGTGAGAETDEGHLPATAGDSTEPRSPRRRGHHRFARGSDLPAAKRQRPSRVKVRASAVPR